MKMKENKIAVLKVEPGKRPKLCCLKNDLDALQKAVSIGCDSQGLIEIIELEDGICLLCNEEGKLLGLEGNRKVGNDIIAGVFYITAEDGEGDLASLNDKQVEKYTRRFWEIESYTTEDVLQSVCIKLFYD